MPNLPAPKKNTIENISTAISVIGAVGDAVLKGPYGTITAEITKNWLLKKHKENQEIIIEQFRSGDHSSYETDLHDELFPMGFKFYRASLEGASKAKLILLAKLMRGAVAVKGGAGIFDQVSERIRRLSDQDLILISKILELYKSEKTIIHDLEGKKIPYIFGKLISENTDIEYIDAIQSLVNLNSVGFIIQKAELNFDMTETGYYLGTDFFSLCDLALAEK